MRNLKLLKSVILTALLSFALLPNDGWTQTPIIIQADAETIFVLEFGVILKDQGGKLTVINRLNIPTEASSGSTLHEGDVITSLNGKRIQNAENWRTVYKTIKENEAVTLEINRSSKKVIAKATKSASGSGFQRIVTNSDGSGGSTQSFRMQSPESVATNYSILTTKHLPGFVFSERDGRMVYFSAGNPSAGGDLQPGDIITSLNDKKVVNFKSFEAILDADPKTKRLRLKVERGGKILTVTIDKP